MESINDKIMEKLCSLMDIISSKEDIINIINNQASREQRNSIADMIILNNSTLDDLKNQVIKIHQKLLGINIDE